MGILNEEDEEELIICVGPFGDEGERYFHTVSDFTDHGLELSGGDGSDVLVLHGEGNVVFTDENFFGVENIELIDGYYGLTFAANYTTDTVITTENTDYVRVNASASNADFDVSVGPSTLRAGLITGAGDDRLEGGDGNDYLRGGSGNDYLVGGDGNDWLIGSHSLYGSPGVSGDNILIGGAGNDMVFGGAGADRLEGGEGDDRLYGRQGADYIEGGEGNDDLCGGWESDTLRGGLGDDYLSGDGDSDRLYGGEGNDEMLGGTEDDYLSGDAGDDSLFGGDGNDVLHGGEGNDHLSGGLGDDVINAGAGDDVISYGDLRGFKGHGKDTIHGGEGDDMIYVLNAGLEFGAVIDGGSGSDTLRYYGGSVDDVLGSNINNVERIDFRYPVNVNLTFDSTFEGSIVIDGNWNFHGSDPLQSALTIDASASDAEFTMLGGARSDTLQGGRSADSIFGGGGDDTLIYDQVSNDEYDGGTQSEVLGLGDVLLVEGEGSEISSDLFGESMSGIEILDIRGSGNNTLNLSAFDAADRLDALTDTDSFIVKGNEGDAVLLGAEQFINEGQVDIGGDTYIHYVGGGADASVDLYINNVVTITVV
ncbi:MAG: calcium-binding protein [Coxiellaceae bacterium]|nr:calcium-binding protein [Coxiellaceae bacterium]